MAKSTKQRGRLRDLITTPWDTDELAANNQVHYIVKPISSKLFDLFHEVW